MGRQKHRLGRAGTWLEVKVRNGQDYLYERTRVYQGGRSHITSKYLYKLPPAEPEYVKQPQATAHTPNRDHTDYAGQPKQKPRAAAGGEEMGRFAARCRQVRPPVNVLRNERNQSKSLNEGHLASEKGDKLVRRKSDKLVRR